MCSAQTPQNTGTTEHHATPWPTRLPADLCWEQSSCTKNGFPGLTAALWDAGRWGSKWKVMTLLRAEILILFLREGRRETKRMEELRKAHSRLGVHFSSSDQKVA